MRAKRTMSVAALLAAGLSGCYSDDLGKTVIERGVTACKERGGVPSVFVSAVVARVDCAVADVVGTPQDNAGAK